MNQKNVRILFNIYENSPDNNARYLLGTQGYSTLIWFGINPNIATNMISGNTTNKINSFTKYCGYDSFLLINIYPERNSHAYNLNDFNVKYNETNQNAILQKLNILSKNQNRNDIVAIWGDSIDDRDFLRNCLRDILFQINLDNLNWFSLLYSKYENPLTASGHPRHPAGIRGKFNNVVQLVPFYINQYINSNLK